MSLGGWVAWWVMYAPGLEKQSTGLALHIYNRKKQSQRYHHAFFSLFWTWCLQCPQCNSAAEWHHWMNVIRLPAAFSHYAAGLLKTCKHTRPALPFKDPHYSCINCSILNTNLYLLYSFHKKFYYLFEVFNLCSFPFIEHPTRINKQQVEQLNNRCFPTSLSGPFLLCVCWRL